MSKAAFKTSGQSSQIGIFAQVTGDKKLTRYLEQLQYKEGGKITRAANNKGSTELAKAIRKQAPDKTSKKTVGKKNKKDRGIQTVIVGINVGKKGTKRKPHAILSLGTKQRKRKKIGGIFANGPNRSTGRISRNPWVERGTAQGMPAAIRAMRRSVVSGLRRARRGLL